VRARPRGSAHAERLKTTRREGTDETDGPRRMKPRDEEPPRRSDRHRTRERPPSEERQRAPNARSRHVVSFAEPTRPRHTEAAGIRE